MTKLKFWLLGFWLLLAFFSFFFTSAVAFESNFHRGVYHTIMLPGEGKRYLYFDKTKSHGFNCAHSLPGFTPTDYDSASVATFNLIDERLCWWSALVAQYSRYETDQHNLKDYWQDTTGIQIRFLSTNGQHTGIGGQVTDPQASNGYAWFVSKNSLTDNRDTILFGLWNEPGWHDGIQHIDYSREMHESNVIYYARFNLKVPQDASYSPTDTIARIEAHFMNSARDSIVADSLLFYQDFNPNQYKVFELLFWKYTENDNDSLDYRIYWFKKTDLYIDYVEVYDCRYDTLVNHKPIYQDRILSEIAPFENQYHGTSLFRWYLNDEPAYNHFKANREIIHLLDSLNYTPGIQATGDASWHHPKKFADEIQPHEICYDDYAIGWMPNPEYLQTELNVFASHLQPVTEAAKEHNIEWWYVAGTYKEPNPNHKYLHNTQLRATIFMSLIYGAKGVEYYRYSTDLPWSPQNPNTQSGLLWWNEDVSDWVPIETYPVPNPYSSQPETLLTEVVRINFWLDSLGTTLRSLDWIGACLDSSYNNNDLLGCGAGYIDSIRSHNPADEPHWVQVGFFENHAGDTSYFMLVNRECLETEGANYDVFVTKTGGPYQIRDMYTDSIVGNVNGISDYFTVYLGPGEGKLFRMEEMYPGERIRHVPADYPTIQAAINASVNGDTVLVAPGAYYENINFRGKAITVASQFILDHNPTTIESTIINGSLPFHPDSGSVVTFVSGEDSTSALQGFTITGGTGTSQYGPGKAQHRGGGIYCSYSSPTIINNLIVDNHIPHYGGSHEEWGGGIGCYVSSPTIANNLIVGNSCVAGGFGGGICLKTVNSALIVNNTLVNNTGGGIGIWLQFVPYVISNNVITNNDEFGIWLLNSSGGIISYNDVWNNGGYDFINCPPGMGDTTWGTNVNGTPCDTFRNIIRDPMFVAPDTDYHLKESSPCFNAGDKHAPGLPEFDFDGNPRISGGRVDMGAYEYQTSLILGDANRSGVIEVGDVTTLINYLYKGGAAPSPLWTGDANSDGVINVGDVMYLINYLFKGGPPPVRQ